MVLEASWWSSILNTVFSDLAFPLSQLKQLCITTLLLGTWDLQHNPLVPPSLYVKGECDVCFDVCIHVCLCGSKMLM